MPKEIFHKRGSFNVMIPVLVLVVSLVPTAGAHKLNSLHGLQPTAPNRLKPVQPEAPAGPFTMEQVRSYPYPSELVSSPSGSRIAWVFDEQGIRNVWAAQGPEFKPRRLTDYREDDGQELTGLVFSHDGNYVVYVRGGDHDSNWSATGNLQPDPGSNPIQPKLEICSVAFAGGTPKVIAEGDRPAISPRGNQVAFVKDQQIWSVPIDGSKPAARLLFSRGQSGFPVWSPDGSQLAFVSVRDDHSFIGVFTSDKEPIRYMAPSTSFDTSPRWSPDGTRIAYVRRPGRGGKPETILDLHPNPWSIWVADSATGQARQAWQSPNTLLGSLPQTAGAANLNWGASGRLVFLADLDGWPHLYSVPAAGGTAMLLTPGRFMDEYITVTPDHKYVVYNANTGTDQDDDDRRHLFRVPVDSATPQPLTSGNGIEWTPAVTGDGRSVAFIGAGAQAPPLPMVVGIEGGKPRSIAADRVPADFPAADLVIPKKVVVIAEDGVQVHCQLFERAGAADKRPAVIFVHGGPPRQMLLGWHYMDYYTNGYAVNQYLANHGYIVLAVNYRLGIGYGHYFHHPEHAGSRGAAEYKDVVAAGRFLQTYKGADAKRIGIWGGSYGGFLTALALARNSDVFAAGVDLHGVHDWSNYLKAAMADEDGRVEKTDVKKALEVAWNSSPVASIATWKSPVLLIHGDDDRNVQFHQTVDLARRLAAAGVPFEEMVIPDEIHGFLRHRSWLQADKATVEYFDKVFGVH
jgi:dipeptidyl aminopeptidase/acylaminoacyl peptidase